MIAHRFSAAAAILSMLAASSLGCSTTEEAQSPTPSSDAGSDARPNKPSDSGPDDGSDDEVDAGRDSGADGGPKCKAPTDCPDAANECIEVTCTAGVCGEKPKAAGTTVSTQTAGDCQKNECDGAGKILAVDDDTDVPNDNDACTQDRCAGGEPEHTNVSDGTPCGANLTCVNGACTGCATANDCPGVDDECKTRTCSAGKCGFDYATDGKALAAQVAGDCKKSVCDGAGNSKSVDDDADLPADDGSQCTNEVCNAGMPSHPNEPKGLACNQGGGTLCNGAGVCVAPACDDGIQNGNETGLDCGGVCGVCPNGEGCAVATDCASGKCTGNICQAPTCTDGVKNGSETGVDCGGSCNPCPGSLTTVPADGDTNVSVSTTIAITFSTAMNTATLTAQAANGGCSGSIQVSTTDDFTNCIGFNAPLAFSDGDKVVTLTPPTALTHETTYWIKVTNAAQDAQGGAFTEYRSATGFTTAAPPAPVQCTGSQVVISQVYGGGGLPGAVRKYDFVELHNRGTGPADLAGLSLAYAGATGTSWSATSLPAAGSIPAGGYYLIRLGSDGNVGADLPQHDFTASNNMSADKGKIVLVRGSAGNASCPSNLVDFVGYGSANCKDGAAAAAPSLTTAIIRKADGCTDTNNNGNDFETGAPTPRNSSSAVVKCGCDTFVNN